ncbi:hypothetical protein KEM52_006454, partial [Ascosphaera acerosa]
MESVKIASGWPSETQETQVKQGQQAQAAVHRHYQPAQGEQTRAAGDDDGPGVVSIDPDSAATAAAIAAGVVPREITACLSRMQRRSIAGDGGSPVGEASERRHGRLRAARDPDDATLITYYALACELRFRPRFRYLASGAPGAGGGGGRAGTASPDADAGAAAGAAAAAEADGMQLTDPQVVVSAWRTQRSGDWKRLKARVCRLALQMWERRSDGLWDTPREPAASHPIP